MTDLFDVLFFEGYKHLVGIFHHLLRQGGLGMYIQLTNHLLTSYNIQVGKHPPALIPGWTFFTDTIFAYWKSSDCGLSFGLPGSSAVPGCETKLNGIQRGQKFPERKAKRKLFFWLKNTTYGCLLEFVFTCMFFQL